MNRLLIIRFSAMGDVAMLVPVVRAFAEQYPDVAITMLSQERMGDLFRDMPGNVVFRGVDIHSLSLRRIVQGLGHYDQVADMHDVLRSIYIRTALWLRGAKIASIRKGRSEKRRLIRGDIHQPLQPTAERYADVLRRLGYAITLPSIPMHDGQGIGIAPFAAHEGKIYPLERMEKVVAILAKQSYPIVLLGGGEAEQEILQTWASRYPHVQSIAGQYSLSQELTVIRGLRLMVTMDSANMHLASLVGTRVISIWGATHPFAGFLGYGQRIEDCIQRDIPCRPCSVYGNTPCRYGDYRCMDIHPEQIAQTIINAYENSH